MSYFVKPLNFCHSVFQCHSRGFGPLRRPVAGTPVLHIQLNMFSKIVSHFKRSFEHRILFEHNKYSSNTNTHTNRFPGGDDVKKSSLKVK